MGATLQLRAARASDVASIAKLYRELDQTHQMLDVGLRLRDEKGRIEHINSAMRSSHDRIIVAVLGESVVGFAACGFARRAPDVIIEAISVHKPFRRRGIGRGLVRAMEKWAMEKRARYVELDVYEFNPEARAFYEALGYLTTSRRMRKDPKFRIRMRGL